MPIRPARPDDAERRRLGAWYTPEALVEHLTGLALGPVLARAEDPMALRVLDPACGDGRFLVAAARRIAGAAGRSFEEAAACCHGVDRDPAAVNAARRALGSRADLLVADAMTCSFDGFDAVLGNPPFRSPLVAASGRPAGALVASAPYADDAAGFLVLAHRAARPDGGRVGFVLPQSFMANRDAAWARHEVLRAAALEHLWWSPRPVFDAAVRTVALVTERGSRNRLVARTVGLPPAPAATAPAPRSGATWSGLLLDLAGVPPVELPPGGERLGDVAEVLAGGFRDQFYALAPLVSDTGDGPPLVTAGLVDPGGCSWGLRPTRVAGRTFAAPRVRLHELTDARVAAWARRRLAPKVLVASQTRVLEAAVDPGGAWLPGIPVLSVLPPATGRPLGVWELGAVLTSPAASAWAAAEALGSGLSATSVRVTAPLLRRLPLPAGPLEEAGARLRAGDLEGAARATQVAYGTDDPDLLGWWLDGVRRARRAEPDRSGGAG